MATVWVVSNSGHDYASAASRGEVVFLYEGKVNVFASDRLVKEIESKLKDSNALDFLLPSGNAMANCITFATLMNMHGKVNVLIFSFKNQVYEVRTIQKTQFDTTRRVECLK